MFDYIRFGKMVVTLVQINRRHLYPKPRVSKPTDWRSRNLQKLDSDLVENDMIMWIIFFKFSVRLHKMVQHAFPTSIHSSLIINNIYHTILNNSTELTIPAIFRLHSPDYRVIKDLFWRVSLTISSTRGNIAWHIHMLVVTKLQLIFSNSTDLIIGG